MKDLSRVTPQSTVGLDVGDRYVQVCILDEHGEILEESRIPTTPKALRARFEHFEQARFALEAGTHSAWISRLLTSLGHEVLVANPRKLRGIYQNEQKSDRADAEWLARVARLDPRLLAPITHRGPQAQADLSLLRAREALVAARTQLVNHVRGSVKSFGARLPKGGTAAFPKKVTESIPEELRPALLPVLDLITALTAAIRRYQVQIQELTKTRYPAAVVLQQVPGVGPVTALTYILTIEDPGRFAKSRSVGRYLGLTRRQSQSGEQDPQLRITKAGDRNLRQLLVLAAHYILGPFGPDTDLKRWGLALAVRGGKNAKKRAIVAVARKLAVLLHRLWVTAEVYEPLRNSAPSDLRQSA